MLPRLAECTWLEAAILARDPRSVVLLPLGAVEQHGPHLPLLVDWLGAEEIARRVAPHLSRAGYRPVLVPSLPYGVSLLAEDWSGTVSLSATTLRRLVLEIIASLARHGFRRFVLTNYQADPGHLAALRRITRDAQRASVQVLVAGFTPGHPPSPAMVNDRVTALMRSPRPAREWHAGELETALVLAARPTLVRRQVARALPPAWIDVQRALAAGPTTFRRMHPPGRGYFGWPAVARARTGRRVMALRARLIARDLIAALASWPGSARRRADARQQTRRRTR
ncbi:MAG TPA: creatininase family protein [Methylomirabilota bacterium]|jgi:creatinine amidohydrolase|nr:creatininase family protein [Methylomirabilota bacterium]